MFSADGMNAYFTADDGGNLVHMHEYWENGLASMAGSVLRVFTGTYRPLGGIYYFALYRIAGLNPFPFRAVCLTLMLCNLMIAFAFLRRMSNSPSAAFIGAILLARHPALLWLFYSSGTIYEILCFLFYCSTLLLYSKWRQEGVAVLGWKRVAVLLVLNALALDSKEMAMTLPAALLLIELLCFSGQFGWPTPAKVLDFFRGRGRVILATSILTALTIAFKVLSHNPLSDDPRYAIHSLSSVFDATRGYHAALLYGDLFHGIHTFPLFLLWAGILSAGFGLKSRSMKMGFGLVLISMAPVCVISPRGGYMLYLPLIGWALLISSFLVAVGGLVIEHFAVRYRQGLSIASALTVAVLIAVVHDKLMSPYISPIRQEQQECRRIIQQMRDLVPRISGDTFLLLQNDSLPPGWGLTFLTQLAYGTPRVLLERTKMMDHHLSSAEMGLYDHVFIDDGVRLRETRVAASMREHPPVQFHFVPARVRPGERYSVSIPELRLQTIDIATRSLRRVPYVSTARRWCTLDASGTATFETPYLPPQSISIIGVRAQGGPWTSASGTIEVAR
jgi:hypothetical protein